MECYPYPIDLHMHTTVSDGTDTPQEILAHVKETGIALFSVTDHDAVKAGRQILSIRTQDDPLFVTGAEFSCKDEEGKYHILGYGFDPDAPSVSRLVAAGHGYRIKKVMARLEFLKTEFGFSFPQQELDQLMAMDNPGKPHIANLMVKYGFADSKEQAIKQFINQIRFRSEYVRPEEAIAGILGGGGVPVLAHGPYGSGDELIVGEELDQRIRRLMEFGLRGVEAYYSGFTDKLRRMMLTLAQTYDLYVTAGSDYHGRNKLVELGDTGLPPAEEYPEGLRRFLNELLRRMPAGQYRKEEESV